MLFHVGDSHVQDEMRTPRLGRREPEPPAGVAAIDQIKLSLDQPANTRHFIGLEDSRRSELLQFFLQVLRKGDRDERFANRHFAFRDRFVVFEDGLIDAERPDIDRGRMRFPNPAVGREMHRPNVLGVHFGPARGAPPRRRFS